MVIDVINGIDWKPKCYGVTVERGNRENSGSDVPVQRWERE